jgi:hypothetical protein
VNVAVQVRATVMLTLLLQPVPLQPAKVEPDAGVAIRVTTVPLEKEAEHVPPQLMPAGLLATVPFPVPLLVVVLTTFTVSVNSCGGGGDVIAAGVVPHTYGE